MYSDLGKNLFHIDPLIPRDDHCSLLPLSSCSTPWDLGFVTDENTRSGHWHPEGTRNAVHLVATWIDWDSETQSHKQHFLGPAVLALRGVCLKGSQSIRGFCCLNIYCLVRIGKVPFHLAPAQYHRFTGLWLEASHILVGNHRRCLCYTILTTSDNRGLCFLRLKLNQHKFTPWWVTETILREFLHKGNFICSKWRDHMG